MEKARGEKLVEFFFYFCNAQLFNLAILKFDSKNYKAESTTFKIFKTDGFQTIIK